jgi:hypothetical protein
MNVKSVVGFFIVVSSSLTAPCFALGEIAVPKFAVRTNSLYPASTQREVHLIRSLFVETNKAFDEKVVKSFEADAKPPAIVTFHLVSFVFSYPTTNDYVGSASEIGRPNELIWTTEGIARREGATNKIHWIPLNYVRIVDDQRKVVTAELDMLIGVAPLKNPEEVRYFRRSFRFVHGDVWRED